MPEKEITIYTDGGCRGNPGPGAWAAYLLYKGNKKIISGFNTATTNNIMELTAVIEGLKSLKYPCRVTLFTDSKYVCTGITEWVENWIENNWKTAAKKPVKNLELWQALNSLAKTHRIKWNWVKGHSGNEGNEICDTEINRVLDENMKKGV